MFMLYGDSMCWAVHLNAGRAKLYISVWNEVCIFYHDIVAPFSPSLVSQSQIINTPVAPFTYMD